MPTSADLREKVLTRLGVIGEGQTSEAYDASRMDDLITYEFAWLESRGLNYWVDDIPAAVMTPLIEYLASISAKEFAPGPEASPFEMERGSAFRRLVSAVAVEDHSEPLRTEYY